MAPTADDEIDHFRKIDRLLKEICRDGTALLWKDSSDRYLDAFKVTEIPTWADVAVF